MGGFGPKGRRIACQNERCRVQIAPVICPGKTLQKPAAKKASSARNKDPLSAQLLPQSFSAGQNLIQIFPRDWLPSPSPCAS